MEEQQEFKKLFDNYEISRNGIIRNIKTGRILKPYLEKGKHKRYTLNKQKYYLNHLLYYSFPNENF